MVFQAADASILNDVEVYKPDFLSVGSCSASELLSHQGPMNKDNSLGGKSESRISEADIGAIMQVADNNSFG